MSEAKHAAAPWAFEAEETSSGPMFSVYDSCGQRLTEPYIDEQKARLIAVAPELRDQLRNLCRAYVNLLETGRDRIISLGGECDPVDRMEAGDPALIAARTVLSKAGGRS